MPTMSPNKDVQKNAQDWVRDLRFSNQVNMQTMGVDTDRVTPQLLLASSNKLLGISKGQQEGDMKDSLQFQRFYGPVEYFAERIQKDGGSVARSMLWKATNRGNLDFIGSGSLQPHVNAVFHESNLSQFVDNSTPIDGIDNSQKVTRIGEGGLSDEDSAPIEMRLVQPSYYGYVDPCRTAEKCYDEKTQIYTKKGWKSVTEMSLEDEFAVLIDGKPSWSKPISLQSFDHDGLMYCFANSYINFSVTPGHRMYVADEKAGNYSIEYIDNVFGNSKYVLCGAKKASEVDERQKWFYLPKIPQAGTIKNIDKVDIADFARFMGWYLSEGSFDLSHTGSGSPDYRVRITQSPELHPEYYEEIRDLVEKLPFGAHPKHYWEATSSDITIKRKQLYCYLEQFGGSLEKFIPDWIFEAPTEARWAFVDAILKGDGSGQRDLNTISKRLAEDFARLLFELGQSVRIIEQDQNYVSHVTGKPTGPIYQVTWHKRYEHKLQSRKKECSKGYHTCYYKGKVYCPTVPGGLVYVRRNNSKGFWCGNSPGITGYLTKNVLKGTDGKLYQKFINMHTGKEELVDAQTAAKSIVTTDEYLDSKDDYVYAIGGPRGLRIVKRSDVDYILPHSDDAFSASANTVPMLSGIKAMRLLMGCHHPETPVAVVDSNGYTHIVPAKRLGHMGQIYVLGCDKKGRDQIYAVRKVITRVPAKKSKFKKVILSSGRVLLTSAEHKWWIYNEKFQLKQAKDLQEGMLVPRSLFTSMPVRLTEIMGTPVTREICVFMGRLIRSLRATTYSYRVDFVKDKERGVDQSTDIVTALEQLGIKNYNLFHSRGIHAVSIKDPVFEDWVNEHVGMLPEDRKIPSEILSLPEGYTSIFLDSYYKDLQTIGQDNQGDTWLLSIANPALRDSLSFMLNKIYTDTKYRDYTKKDFVHRALELVPASTSIGDVVLEKITKIMDVQAPPVMIDIDCDDNVYAVANGIITHNSKYVSQAVPLQEREAPLVRNLDKATGMDMPTKMGKLLGTQWAPKSGMVKAVREDRIDMIYDDGTTGSVPIYKNFPANAKGWLTNYPKVKAGDKVSEGQLLATSNYTDDNGVLAMGRNLRMAYMSYHGGTYEDAITISQSAAKKLGYTTMYKTDMDKDKNIRTAKHLYMSWKPGKFTREQLQNLDDQGVVKVGATVNKGDPVILGIRTTEPSPGTLGKRILSDVTEIWEHANPGVVTDVVNGKNGIKVFATVSSPLREADKISGFMGDKGTCYSADTQVLTKNSWKYFKDLTDEDEVAVLGIDGTAHFQKPSARQVYDYEGQMYGFRSKLLSWLVTPDHYMWTCPRYEFEKGDRQFSRKKVEDIWGGNDMCQVSALFEDTGTKTQITLAQPIYPKSDYEGSRRLIYPIKDFAALLGIYLAQGCIGHSNVVRITQKRDLADPVSCDRCDKLEALFARMQLPWRRDGYHYDITHKALRNYLSQFGKSGDKFIPEEVFTEWPHEAQQILLEWLYLGDGEKYGKINRLRVTSAQLIDDAQRLYILNGYYAATIHNYPPRYREYKGQIRKHAPLHGVTFSSSKYKHMQYQGFEGSKYPGYYKQLYSGKVYCCTVSTGVILVQRQGRPMWCGNCAQIIPDDQMPRDSKGRPLQVLFDPLGIVSRCNPSQMMQAGLGKVAAKTGKPIVVPAFMPKGQSRLKYVKDLMKANNVPWKQDVYDPATGRTIKNVFTGVRYYLPLKHIADTKMSARGTAQYTAQQVPMGGGEQGSKKIGNLEVSGLVGHNAFNFLHDAKLIRGQANSDFWRSIRTGQIPTVPGEPLAHKKFFAHLQGSGMQIKRDNEGFTIFALSNKDVNELAGSRQLKSTDTYQQKSFRPIAGGLFGQDIFGPDGDKWAYIQLDSPLPNPVMQEPLARLLGISDTEFQQIVRGKGTQKDLHNAVDMKKKLATMDLEKQANKALAELKTSTKAKKDKALKKYVAIARMRDAGVRPQEYMLDRIPVLPPKFRPITSHGGLTMVADSNYLYSQLLNARDDLREAKDLPEEYQEEGQSNLYQKWKELVGLYDPQDIKLKSKNVKGLLKWALGNKGPKCYDDETDILTERGWIPFKEYNDSDIRVATVNPVTDAFQWQKPTEIVHQQGPAFMVHMKNRYLDSMVTLNHEHYVSLRKGKTKGHIRFQPYKKYKVQELLNHSYRMRVKTAATAFQGNLPRPPVPVSSLDTFSQFVGWFIAQGYLHTQRPIIYIAVKAGGRDDKLLFDLYQKLGVAYHRNVYSRPAVKKGQHGSVCNIPEGYQIVQYSIYSRQLYNWLLYNTGKGAQTKKLSREILEWSPAYLRALWRGWFRGDGNKYVPGLLRKTEKLTWQNRDSLTDNGNTISTVSKHLVDNLMQIGVKIGVQACIVSPPDTRVGHLRPVYRVGLHGFPYAITQGKQHISIVPYSGNVHCVTVPNGLVVTRRNNRVLVSGNSSAYQQKVLGSTVDTVGRAVVIPSTKIKLNQVGLPIQMAWNIFAPFVTRKLVQQGYSPVDAMLQVKQRKPVAAEALAQAVKQRPIVLNRAPSLHKLSLIGLNVKLTNGHAIKVNPSLDPPLAQDHDGDQDNIHVPVSKKAIQDVRQKMMPERNLISLRKGSILYGPEKGYVQGLYVATRMGESKDVKTFETTADARKAYLNGQIDIDTPIVIKQK